MRANVQVEVMSDAVVLVHSPHGFVTYWQDVAAVHPCDCITWYTQDGSLFGCDGFGREVWKGSK